MNEQDYTVVTTPGSKQNVKIRNYTTGIDEIDLMDLRAKYSKTTIVNEVIHQELDARVNADVLRFKLTRFVIDIDGKTEDVANEVFKMRTQDCNFVVDEVDKIASKIGGIPKEEKKD